MLTSQQLEMQEKLPSLLKTYGGNRKAYSGNISDASAHFMYLCEKYMGEDKDRYSVFVEKTKVNKGVYYELRGDTQKLKSKKEITLVRVVFGLRTSYEEAFMLFHYCGKNLLCDDPYIQKLNNELLKLDTVDWSKKNGEGSMVLSDAILRAINEK